MRTLSKSILFSSLLALVLPNLLFWAAAHHFGVGRAIFNLDYILVVAVMALGFWRAGLFLVVIVMVTDALCLVVQVFPFMRLEDLFYLARFIWVAPLDYKIWSVYGVLLVLAGILIFFMMRTRISKEASLFLLMSFFAVFYFQDSNEGDSFWRVAGDKNVDSQLSIFLSGRNSPFFVRFDSEGKSLDEYVGPAASDEWRSDLESGQIGDRLLLIVNESWGIAHNSKIQAFIADMMEDVPSSEFAMGELPFVGATVAAELRELCRLHPKNFSFHQDYEELERCFPAELSRRGYHTLGMHGATGMMYDRKDWYGQAGFLEDMFFENMLGVKRCFSFPGACDMELRDHVADYFAGTGRRFFYWLTLNTHSSYDLRDLDKDVFSCTEYGIAEETESCRNAKLQAQFFFGLKELLSMPQMAGVDVIIVGDHEPRFVDRIESGEYFFEGKVPWIRIKTKVEENSPWLASKQ